MSNFLQCAEVIHAKILQLFSRSVIHMELNLKLTSTSISVYTLCTPSHHHTSHTPHHPHLLTPSQVNHINLAADNPLEFARCLLSAAQTVTLSIKRQVSNHVLYICLFSLSHRYQRVAGLKGGERGGGRGRGGVEGMGRGGEVSG